MTTQTKIIIYYSGSEALSYVLGCVLFYLFIFLLCVFIVQEMRHKKGRGGEGQGKQEKN